jgi:putative ABC transport system permease protein
VTSAVAHHWAFAWRLARRDFDLRLRGLRLLAICLFLGVAMLAAIGSLADAIRSEISTREQEILGGDIEIAMTQREASAAELARIRDLTDYTRLSATIRTRAMARRVTPSSAPDIPPAVLTELKGVDAAYPLVGQFVTSPAAPATLRDDEIWIAPALADRLGLKRGDKLRYGDSEFTISGYITTEPDRVSEGFTLGPVAITSLNGMRGTDLLQPGALYETKYRLLLSAGQSPAATQKRVEAAFPQAGWDIDTRDNAAPDTDRFFSRLGEFLALIGLAALAIARIGVGNGVTAYLAKRRTSIATLKVLGATSGDIARVHGVQIASMAGLAIAAGLVAGIMLPPLVVTVAGDLLPVRPGFAVQPLPLLLAAAYGVLITIIFAIPPLARARRQPAAAIFRARVDRPQARDWPANGAVVAAIVLVLALAIGTSSAPLFAATALGGIGGALLILLGIGVFVRWVSQRLPRPRAPLFALAVGNLHRPGAQTASLVIALGLSLTLFVTLAVIQTSIDAEVRSTVPERAPGQFVLDIPATDEARFRTLITQTAPNAVLNMVPTLRGRITAYNDTRVADLAEIPDDAWFLRGERGVTYSDAVPEGSELVAGAWWPRDYSGPPLISLDAEAARALNLSVGDNVTVSILGREVTAQIASLRRINWDTMGFNYVMVFSPNTLRSAPHTLTATIDAPGDGGARATRAILAAFPSASVIELGEVIEQAGNLLRQMSGAIMAAASVTILAGIAVLIGAIAAGREARSYDNIMLKILGATRFQLLFAQMLEYGILALILSAVAMALGGLAGWGVLTQIFEFRFVPNWWVVAGVLIGGGVGTLIIGLLGLLPLLAVRPNQALRQS